MTHITVSFQDPLVTAIVADSAINKLQTYIINYRTKKAKQDYEFQNQMCEKYKNFTRRLKENMMNMLMQIET